MSVHEEEALGKAYDARLMRRLLTYLWPYRPVVAVALAAIIGHSVLQLAQPYLTKLAIDTYIASGDFAGLNRIAVVFLFVLLGSFLLECVQTYILQMTGQRIMFERLTRHSEFTILVILGDPRTMTVERYDVFQGGRRKGWRDCDLSELKRHVRAWADRASRRSAH